MRRRAAVIADVICVVGFVAIGRHSHSEAEAIGGIAVVAAPFLIGTAVGWALSRNTQRPAGQRTGVIVWACTAGLGLVLRGLVFGRGTPVSFVLVATGFLGLALLGWRGVRGLAIRRRRSGTPESAPGG